MTRRLLRYVPVLALCGALLTAVPAVRADEDVAEQAEEAEAAEHGGEHHGPLHFDDVLHSTEFWAAVINFSLLVFLLVRFGRAPIREFLSTRRKDMERAINEAAEAKAKAEAKLKEYNDRLAQLDSEMAKLRADLIAAGEEDKKRIVAEAEEAAKRMKHETEALIDQHAKALAAQVRRELVDGAIATAERLLREKITAADQQQLAEVFRQQVGDMAAKQAGGPS